MDYPAEEMMPNAALCCILAFIGTHCVGGAGMVTKLDQQESYPSFSELSRRLESHLEDNILSFLLRYSPDQEYGGFVTQLDRRGRWYGSREKRVVTQTRMIWTFSSAHRAGLGDGRYLEVARAGVSFLLKYLWDEKEGGWCWSVSREGNPIEMHKRIYGQAFGIYGLCEYYFASDDEKALEKAEETFNLFEEKAYSKEYGGYYTCDFSRNWKRQGSGNRSAGTHLHLLESFAGLFQATGKERYRRRVKELLDILVDRMFLSQYGCNVEEYTEDWKPVMSSGTLYVHDLEAAWLIIEAAEALGLNDEKYRRRARSLVDYSLKYGWNSEYGGFFQSGSPGQLATDRDKNYNAQGEGLVA
ncbi:MAG: AGE family epimerase/isomerase, partial [Candidatus Thermoplasmatota archaeon]|nr:AGE family epimerase/isomerase [Candidatus Thermoplasmatota archaeon]